MPIIWSTRGRGSTAQREHISPQLCWIKPYGGGRTDICTITPFGPIPTWCWEHLSEWLGVMFVSERSWGVAFVHEPGRLGGSLRRLQAGGSIHEGVHPVLDCT